MSVYDINGKPLSGGSNALSEESKNLLVTLLSKTPYTGEQEANLKRLAKDFGIEVNPEYEPWDYEWDCTGGVAMTDDGWKPYTAYSGFQTSFDSEKGQNFAMVDPANASAFGLLYLSTHQTATEGICEAVVNFETMPDYSLSNIAKFAIILSDGERMVGARIMDDRELLSSVEIAPGVDYKIRVDFGKEQWSIYIDGVKVYTSGTYYTNSSPGWNWWGQGLKTMLGIQHNGSVNVKSYKYKVVTA